MTGESGLAPALAAAAVATGPVLVDVGIDPEPRSPRVTVRVTSTSR